MTAFQDVLPGAQIECTTNLFECGGNSLTAACLAEKLGVPVSTVILYPTVRTLARAIATNGRDMSKLSAMGTNFTIKERPALCYNGLPRIMQKADCTKQVCHTDMFQPSSKFVAVHLGRRLQQCNADSSASKLWDTTPHNNLSVLDAGHLSVVSDQNREICCVWRTHVGTCVDTACVVLVPGYLQSNFSICSSRSQVDPITKQSRDTDRSTACDNSSPPKSWNILCCSHGGDVLLLRGSDGVRLWSVKLPSWTDAGMTVTSDLKHAAVCCGDNRLYFIKVCQ